MDRIGGGEGGAEGPLFRGRGKDGSLPLHPQRLGQAQLRSGRRPDPAPRSASSRTSRPSDNQFRMSILERLEQMEKRMADLAAAGRAPCRSPAAPPIQVPV